MKKSKKRVWCVVDESMYKRMRKMKKKLGYPHVSDYMRFSIDFTTNKFKLKNDKKK